MEDLLRAVILRAGQAGEATEPRDACDGSLGSHRSGDDYAGAVANLSDGGDGDGRGDPVADADQELRVRERRLGKLAKVHVDEVLHIESITLRRIAGVLHRRDERPELVRDGRVGEECAYVRLHVGAVEDEGVRHCCFE